MKNRYFLIIIFLLIVWSDNAFSQTDCVTDPPLSPVLTSVSIQPETGNTVFTWTPSTSTGIAAYIIYSYKNGDGMPLDTIRDPSATSYVLTDNSSKYLSVTYVVAAMRLPRCTSILSNAISSIFENVTMDTCTRKMRIVWNSYPSSPVKVMDYSVLVSIAGGSFAETAKVSADSVGYTLNDFTLNADYCFVIRANLANGAFSTSNKSCVLTKLQRPPQWINADQATINPDSRIELSFTIDPLSELRHFSLERKTGTGIFQQIAQPVAVNGKVSYTDEQADTKAINYYRLSALNSCNLPVTVSNLASNIVLSYKMAGNNIVLFWNPYEKWLGTISGYKVFIDTGNGFVEKTIIAGSDSTFSQDYQLIMFDVTADHVCFYVSASESSNPYSISGESVSSPICTAPVELITVPNVFTPNNDLKNDLFRPVLSFTPSSYHLVISDRQGNTLFESRDYLESWDGISSGNHQPQGVCLWFLKLTTPSGKVISRTGTITIITAK